MIACSSSKRREKAFFDDDEEGPFSVRFLPFSTMPLSSMRMEYVLQPGKKRDEECSSLLSYYSAFPFSFFFFSFLFYSSSSSPLPHYLVLRSVRTERGRKENGHDTLACLHMLLLLSLLLLFSFKFCRSVFVVAVMMTQNTFFCCSMCFFREMAPQHSSLISLGRWGTEQRGPIQTPLTTTTKMSFYFAPYVEYTLLLRLNKKKFMYLLQERTLLFCPTVQ